MDIDITTGIVQSQQIAENRDGGHNRRMLKVAISNSKDVQTVEWRSGSGDDAAPVVGSQVLIVAVGQAWKVAIAADDQIDPAVAEGERRVYAAEGGAIKSSVLVKVSGDVVLNDGGDFAVQFTALENALAALDTALNAEFGKIATAISGLGGSYTPTPISTDISGSKVDKVRLP